MNRAPTLSILDPQDIDQIHQASLMILKNTGVVIPHVEMRRLFQSAGAEVDAVTEIVKIPERLIWRCLESAGKSFTLFGRDRTRQAQFGVGLRNYATSAGQALWLSDDGRQRRYATLTDIPTAARLADGLPMINLVGAMADPSELPAEYRCVEVLAGLIKNTIKPVHIWFYNRESAKYLLEILTVLAGSEEEAARYPLTFPFLEPISPLRFPYDGIDLIFETARFSLPAPIGPMAQAGATAPATLAGTLAQENAEVLAGICVTQLIRPGLATFFGGLPHAFDMRSMQTIFSGPEQALMAVAMTQMGRYYHLPVAVNVGLTDSKVPDAQAGLEAGITLACGAMAGADIFGALGISGVDQATSLVMLIMQHEVICYLERIMRGIEISEAKIGLDVIEAVGPGGNFLAEMHTVENYRQELWLPALLDRQLWMNWAEGGAQTMHQRCVEMKDKILKEHEPEPIDEYKSREIDRIVNTAKRQLLQTDH